MAYCHKCGSLLKEESNFCQKCGSQVKHTPHVSHEAEEHSDSHQTGSGFSFGKFLLIFFLVIIIYFGLNYWASSQIDIDTSSQGLTNIASKFNIQSSYTQSTIETELIVINPTIIPIVLTEISYDVSYGQTQIGQGKSGFIFIMPLSERQVPVNFELNHIASGIAVFQGISNSLQGKQEKMITNIYAGIGSIKIKIGGSE